MLRCVFFLLIISLMNCSCSRQPLKQVNGYVEGRYTYIATSVSGRLIRLNVTRGTPVKRGQLLFNLEVEPELKEEQIAHARVKQAQNARDAIIAKLAYAKVTYERNKKLIEIKAIQQSLLDQEKSKYDVLLAQLAQAEDDLSALSLNLKQAQWRLQQNNSVAPIDGMVFDIYYRIGEYTHANQAVLSLLAPEDVKAIFYVNGLDVSALQLGQQISVFNAGHKESYKAQIDYISPSVEFTPPVIYSDQTHEKLTYRIEAKFRTQDAFHVHPGQPVTINYASHE